MSDNDLVEERDLGVLIDGIYFMDSGAETLDGMCGDFMDGEHVVLRIG